MQNPGLDKFSSPLTEPYYQWDGDTGLKLVTPEPFLRVANRRYADVMATPTIDATEQGYLYNDQMDPLDPANVDSTSREDVTQGPPMAGGAIQLPVPATNGELTLDRSVNLRQHMAGNPVTQVPGQVRQKLTQDPAILDQHAQQDMQAQLAQGTEDRLKAVQEQDGRNENPAYDRAQQEVRDRLNQRRAHPLHQAAYDYDRGEWLYDLDDPNYFRKDPAPSVIEGGTHQPMVDIKPVEGDLGLDQPSYHPGHQACDGCEELGYSRSYHPSEPIHTDQEDLDYHPYQPVPDLPRGERLAAQIPHFEDPVYPYSGRVDPEDTVDLDNPQTGDDTYRSEPGLDEAPDRGLMDKVFGPSTGEETPEHERAADAHERFFRNLLPGMPAAHREMRAEDLPESLVDRTDAEDVAGGFNNMMNKVLGDENIAPPGGGLTQAQKDHVHDYVEGLKENHKQKVKRLQDEWRARGGRKTGEPMPVARFDSRLTHKGGQQIVPMEGNPFPELEHPIYYVGKCEGCGQTLFDGADVSGDPRGALGEHTRGHLNATDYEVSDQPGRPEGDDRRLHGPSPLICPNCYDDRERQNRVLDKYLGHKAGDQTGGYHWKTERQPDGTRKNILVNHTYKDDREGIWHAPGEQKGSCPECDQGITGYNHRLGHHDPTQDMHDLMDVQGSDGNWNYNEYMHGMFNGMELMRAIHDRDDPEFREAPDKWLEKAGSRISLASFIEMYRTGAMTDEELEAITRQNEEARKWLDEEAERAGSGYQHEQKFYRENPGARQFEQQTHYENPEIRPHPEAQARGEKPREFTPTEEQGHTHVFSVPDMYNGDHPIELHMTHPGYEDRDGMGLRPHYRFRWVYNGTPVHDDHMWGPVNGRPDLHEAARSIAGFASHDADRLENDPDLEDEENHDLREAGSAYHSFLQNEGERLGMAGMDPDPDHPDYDPRPQLIRHE